MLISKCRPSLPAALFAVCCCFAFGGHALASSSEGATPFEGGASDPLPPWRLGGYLGFAQHSPASGRWGYTPDRDHIFLGLQASSTVLRAGPISLAYAPQAVPLLVVTNNPKYATTTIMRNGQPVSIRVARGRGPVVGVAIAPFDLEMDVQMGRRACVYGATAVGLVWFTRDVPVLNSNATNYTFEYGGGFKWEYRQAKWLELGYKFHHLSNDRTGPVNPGLNAHVFYLGWQGRLRHASNRP